MSLTATGTPDTPSAAPMYDGWLIAAMVLGVGGFLLSLLVGGLILLGGVIDRSTALSITTTTAGAFVAVGALGLVLAWVAGRRQLGQPPRALQARRRWVAVVVLTFPVLVGGTLALEFDFVPALLLPPMNVVAIAAPMLIVLALALGARPAFSALRAWVHVLGGAWGAVAVAFAVEIGVAVVLVVLVMIGGVLAPDVFDLGFLSTLLENLGTIEFSDALLSKLLTNPLVLAGVWLVLGLVAPIIEELFKPLGVWIVLLLGRPLDRRTAFVGGVLGGIGFSLSESLVNSATSAAPEQLWVLAIMVRFGTLAMHSLTAGMAGYGLGELRRTRRPLGWFKFYVGAVVLHSVWNTLVMVAVVAAVYLGSEVDAIERAFLSVDPAMIVLVLLGLVAILVSIGGVLLLTVFCLAMLFWWGRRLAQRAQSA